MTSMQQNNQCWVKRRTSYVVVAVMLLALALEVTTAFVPTSVSGFHKSSSSSSRNDNNSQRHPTTTTSFKGNRASVFQNFQRQQSTQLYSFMGSDGGILGIGTPELFTILLVGYFVLGPSDLYKLTKEIGKFVQNFRTFANDATATLENNMENQLQLEEIRKAQRELTDAFSFRRSINVEADSDPFEVNAQSPRLNTEEGLASGTAAAATAVAPDGAPTKKRKIRRIKKKKVAPVPDLDTEASKSTSDDPFGVAENEMLSNNVPDLDLEDDLSESERRAMESMQSARDELEKEQKAEAAKEAAAQTRKERKERLQRAQESSLDSNREMTEMEQSRFQQQLSGDWNSQILANSDKLDPLAGIMERLAILEEEKIAADQRLQEEFKLREENEERFYRQKRELLEEAAAEVQASAYVSTGTESGANK